MVSAWLPQLQQQQNRISCGTGSFVVCTSASRNVFITPAPTDKEILLCELEMVQFPFELDIMQLLLNSVNDPQSRDDNRSFGDDYFTRFLREE